MSHNTKSEFQQQRRLRPDVFTILVMGVLAAVSVITITVTTFRSFFTPDGIMWRLPVNDAAVTAEGLTAFGSEGAISTEPVSGTLTTINVLVTQLNPLSTIALGATIIVACLTGLCGIVCTGGIAWTFLRGSFFSRATSRLVRTLTLGLAIGAATAYACWHLAANGVEAALDVRSQTPAGAIWWAWYAIILFIVCSLGLLDIALARALRMQEEVEGLV
ncbi:hypothetical protein [Leucobacter chinensis]|uniref:hypothetical protein n=1 Tax=Leucobacter chinensis TaxID=2851010 RepID=UPI001C2461D6|nr:hypothetical protein [Leucobacter chinensis]